MRLDLDLNGILKVTATERATGNAKHVVIDNAMERFRKQKRTDAVDRLETVFGGVTAAAARPKELTVSSPENGDAMPANRAEAPAALHDAIEAADALATQAKRVLLTANAQDAEELRAMLADLDAAISRHDEAEARTILRKVEDLVFYLQDA